MDLRPTLPSHIRWHANPADYGRGCQRRPMIWSAQGWNTRNGWGSEEISHAQSVELISPRGQWQHTVNACTVQNPQSNGDGCRSSRYSTNLRCTIWDVCGQIRNAPAPSLAAWGPPTRVMACTFTLGDSTRGTGWGSWRNAQNPYPGASAAGAKSKQGY